MITRTEVIEMARECGMAHDKEIYVSEDEAWDRIERLVHAAYKRGVEDSAKIADMQHFGMSAAREIRLLLEQQ